MISGARAHNNKDQLGLGSSKATRRADSKCPHYPTRTRFGSTLTISGERDAPKRLSLIRQRVADRGLVISYESGHISHLPYLSFLPRPDCQATASSTGRVRR
jgi:hypothetical protein